MIKTNVLKFKKTVAVFMAMLLMVLSLSYTANSSDAVNTARAYRVYNAKTAQYLRSYTLAPLTESYNTRAVIGDDDRVIDWTKSGVVKIINTDDSFGSGFVVGEHTIATAAHCFYDFYRSKTFSKVSEILLFSNENNIVHQTSVTPVEYHIPLSHINGNEVSKNDYALITVKEDLSDYMCFELGVPLDSFVNGSTNATVSVTGFPSKVNGVTVNTHNEHMMYTGNGKILPEPNESLLHYDTYISGGNSGGPVYVTESAGGKTYYTVVGIATGSLTDSGLTTTYSWGPRMTTDLIHFYKSNSNIKY